MKNSTLSVNVLKLTLHGQLVGYLSGFRDGRNVLNFAEEFKADPDRPVFSLIVSQGFPRTEEMLQRPWVRKQRLPPHAIQSTPGGCSQGVYGSGA